MNKKTMKAIIVKKLDAWLASIDDESVRKLAKDNTIVTGGCIASMLLKEDVKDYDFYFRDFETALALAKYYANKLNVKNGKENETDRRHKATVVVENGKISILRIAQDEELKSLTDTGPFEDVFDVLPEDKQTGKFSPVFMSNNAITLTDSVQLIIRFYGEADEIHKNFDFVHAMNYYDSRDKEIILRPEALEALLNKELIYKGSLYPLCSVIRTRKFIKRGFHINAGQYLKMCFQLSQLDLTDMEVLKDQCVGVDSAYFTAVIEGLAKKKDADPNFEITNNYLAAVIDRIF